MLVTDLAMRDMKHEAESWWAGLPRIARTILRLRTNGPGGGECAVGSLTSARLTPLPAPRQGVAPRSQPRSTMRRPAEPAEPAPEPEGEPYRWRRHPQLRRVPAGEPADSSSLAMRGVALARSGRCEDASAAFALAARERECDITAIPGFWSISRRAMQGAVVAYEDAGRFRDAAALEARIRTTLRPRALAPLTRGPELTPKVRSRREPGAG